MQQLVVYLAALVAAVCGHGYMSEPPNRASMWRFGFKTPQNYDDNSYYCGGVAKQWQVFKGGCGPCGDALDVARPRPNENTGKYGTGQVSRRYRSGQEIEVTVKLTANHMGWFRFSVCPLENPSQLEEDACFARHVLKLADGSGTEHKVPTTNTGNFVVRLRLPPGLVCERCVLQWHYKAGNSWGTCPDGSGALGCGAQETFRSCADIAIDKKDGGGGGKSSKGGSRKNFPSSAGSQTLEPTFPIEPRTNSSIFTAPPRRRIAKPRRNKPQQNCNPDGK